MVQREAGVGVQVQYSAVQYSTGVEYRTGEGEDSFQVDSSITVECV